MSKINIYDVNPYIRIARASRLRANYVIARRIIYDYELIYIESGTMHFMYDDVIYPCAPGTFIFIRPGIPHGFLIDQSEVSQPHIHFDLTYTSESPHIPISFKDIDKFSPAEQRMIRQDAFADYSHDPFVVFSDKQQALSLFYEIISVPRGTVTLPQKAKLIQLIYLLIRDNFPGSFNEQPVTQYDVCAQIKASIDVGQGISSSLTDMEEQYAYSRYYLERQFKKQYGISLIAYRNNKRMQHAKKLLLQESVSETADKLGFSSIYAFSRAFKKHFGVSPSHFKNETKHR